jgi:TRAP-type C4-dicarboxylate transport system permease large subunit
MNVFIISAMAKDVPMKEIFKTILPFLASDFARIGLLVFFPSIALVIFQVLS